MFDFRLRVKKVRQILNALICFFFRLPLQRTQLFPPEFYLFFFPPQRSSGKDSKPLLFDHSSLRPSRARGTSLPRSFLLLLGAFSLSLSLNRRPKGCPPSRQHCMILHRSPPAVPDGSPLPRPQVFGSPSPFCSFRFLSFFAVSLSIWS